MRLYGRMIHAEHGDVVQPVSPVVSSIMVYKRLYRPALNRRNGQYARGKNGYLHLSVSMPRLTPEFGSTETRTAKIQLFSDNPTKESTFYSKDSRISGFSIRRMRRPSFNPKILRQNIFPRKNIRLSQFAHNLSGPVVHHNVVIAACWSVC